MEIDLTDEDLVRRTYAQVYLGDESDLADWGCRYLAANDDDKASLNGELNQLAGTSPLHLLGMTLGELVGATKLARLLGQQGGSTEDSEPDPFDSAIRKFLEPSLPVDLPAAHAEVERRMLQKVGELIDRCEDAEELARLIEVYDKIPPVNMDDYDPGSPSDWGLSGKDDDD